MDEEKLINVTPAVATIENPGQLSPEEFQRMLYSWYEEKGLVSDLRSYLRVLMISKLRNTQVRKYEQKTSFSLKKQAFSLVIAEYLLRENCHYTLSIFSTEVPAVANHLPFSLFEAHLKTDSAWKFDEESVLNVLELIGISKGTIESQRIVELYFNNFGALLTCIISSKINKNVETEIAKREGDTISSYLKRALSVLGVSSSLIDELASKIQSNIQQEKEKNAWEIGNHFSAQMDEFQAKITEKENEIKRISSENIYLRKVNKHMKKEIKDKTSELAQKEEKIRDEFTKELNLVVGKLEEMQNQPKYECNQKHCSQTCEKAQEENLLLKSEIVKLQNEIKEHTSDSECLREKINSLSKDLHTSQIKIDFLASCLHHSNQINLKPNEVTAVSSDESSDNITEEVIKQVRSKLSSLERESEDLDVRFQKLKMR